MVKQEELNHCFVVLVARQVQWCVAIVVDSVDMRSSVQEISNNGMPSAENGRHKWRPSTTIAELEWRSVVQEQLDDLFVLRRRQPMERRIAIDVS